VGRETPIPPPTHTPIPAPTHPATNHNDKAMKLYTASEGEFSRDVAALLGNKAIILKNIGENSEALELLYKSVHIQKSINEEDHHDVACDINNVVDVIFSKIYGSASLQGMCVCVCVPARAYVSRCACAGASSSSSSSSSTCSRGITARCVCVCLSPFQRALAQPKVRAVSLHTSCPSAARSRRPAPCLSSSSR
jgi:hypothetical protein